MITQKEELSITVKINGNVEIAKQPIFIDAEDNQVGIGERWRIAIEKGNNPALIEVLGEAKAQAIINEYWV